jgi:hypothetical protein
MPMTRTSEATIDAPHQAVSLHGCWAINSRSDSKKAARAMIGFAMRECDGRRAERITVLGRAARFETVHPSGR